MTRNMTKEEVINYLKSYSEPPSMMKVFPNCEIIKEAVAILEQQNPIPDELEMAAKLYATPSYMKKDLDMAYIDEYGYSPTLYKAFKAGAEWAFGQGVTMNGSVTKIGTDCFLDVDGDQEQMLSVFDNEEEVIVQIRKK